MSAAEIGNLRVRMGIDSAEFSAGVNAVKGSLASLSSSLKTFATGAAAVTLFRSAVASLHDVADFGDVAEAIGLSAEQLQVYNKMALASGASTDIMARGLQSIAEQSTDASSKLSQLFRANGLTIAGKEMNQIILEFMTLLQNAKSPAEQLAIATGVLGDKVGRQLVESLRSGASGWNEAFNSMVNDGWYLSNEQVKAAQEIETKYNQVLANLTSAWQSFIVLVAQGLNAVANPDMGGAANKFRFNNGLGIAPGVNGALGNSQTYGGRGNLPTNINSGNGYSIVKPTENPYNNIKIPPPIVAPIPPGTIDDVYGYGEAVTQLGKEFSAATTETSAFNDSLATISDSIESSLSNALYGLISGTKSTSEAFADMTDSILRSLSDMVSKMIANGLMSWILGGGMSPTQSSGGLFGALLGSFGGFHANGGHLGAGKWGIAGEAGPEIVQGPANITPISGRGGDVQVIVNNHSGQQVNTRETKDGRGNRRIEVSVGEMVATEIRRAGSDANMAIRSAFRATPALTGR